MTPGRHPDQPEPATPGDHPAAHRLLALRRLLRAMLILQRAGWVLALALAVAIGWGLCDYVLRTPGWLRGAVLALGVAGLAVLLAKRVMPAVRFAPSLADLALRLEATPEAGQAGLRGVLASGVELAGSSDPRAVEVGAKARAALEGWRWGSFLRPGRTLAALGTLLAVVLSLAALAGAQPALTSIGLRRVLTPWTDASWPKRTAIADVTDLRVHPLGTALPLQAALRNSPAPAEQTRVEAVYRLIDSAGVKGPVRRAVLTSQGRRVPVTAAQDDALAPDGVLMERLLEPSALEPGADASATLGATLEYCFESDDDQTPTQRVLLVRPPRVLGASVTLTPPSYVAGSAPAVESDLGPGNDDRATLRDVLAGSRVQMTLRLNKPVPAPADFSSPSSAYRAFLGDALGEGFVKQVVDAGGDLTIDLRGPRWTIAWTARESVRLVARPRDEHGLEPDSEAVFRLEARADRPPEAAVIKPGEDLEVLPTAQVELAAEGRDDVGLESLSVDQRLARPRAGSASAQPEAVGEAESIKSVQTPADAPRPRALTLSARLDLPGLGARPGDEYTITALAKDTFTLDGKSHEPVRSAPRRVRVISPEQMAEQIWSELSALRRGAINLAEQQARTAEATRNNRDPGPLARDQSSLTEGIARQQQALQRQRDRVTRNELNNPDLAGVMDAAEQLLEQARERSNQAAGSLRKAEQARRDAQPQAERQEQQAAGPAQEQTEKALEDLAQALDKGQDAWSARRGLERLLQDQKSLREQTAQAGQKLVGRSVDELSAQDRAQVQKLAEQQEDLAQRADDAVQKLAEKAEQLKQQDPSASAALEESARRAQRSQLTEQMQKIPEQIRQNRQQRATQQQDQAIRAMQQALESLEQASRSRDETLTRELASLIESLDQLIARQKQEIDALAKARAGGPAAGLDQAQIRLRTQTLGVAEQARTSRETRAIATVLDAAAGEQAQAVVALRAEPSDLEQADAREQAALAKLNEARKTADEAQRQAQDRNASRQRAELKRAYAELLAEQTDLRTRTGELEQLEAGRRQRAAARELSAPQDELRRKMNDLASRTPEINESEMFKFSHARLDEAAGQAAAKLGEGEAGPGVVRRQTTVIRVLQSLIESLSQAEQKRDEFREQEQQAPGGEGSGGNQKPPLIPPAAELLALRLHQQDALRATREAGEIADANQRREALVDAGKLQGDLAERAEAMLKKLQQQQQQPRPALQPELKPGGNPPSSPDQPGPQNQPDNQNQPQPSPAPQPSGGER
jgi:hypothetical protein